MIPKTKIESILINISCQITRGDKVSDAGLLNEQTTLRLKRQLRKIQTELVAAWNEFRKDKIEAEAIEDPEKKAEGLKDLLEETYTLKAEKAHMPDIEKIESSFNYDFELLEMIAS